MGTIGTHRPLATFFLIGSPIFFVPSRPLYVMSQTSRQLSKLIKKCLHFFHTRHPITRSQRDVTWKENQSVAPLTQDDHSSTFLKDIPSFRFKKGLATLLKKKFGTFALLLPLFWCSRIWEVVADITLTEN